MQNSERQQFEQSWKSAFDGAEMSPSDSVWHSIESGVAGNETAVMKRRVVFYQRIAAATIIFALLSGGVAVYNYRESNEVATTTPKAESTTPKVADGQSPASQSTAPSSSTSPTAEQSLTSQSPSLANSAQQPVRKGKSSNDNTQNGGTDSAITNASAFPPAEDDKLAEVEVIQQSATPGDENLIAASESAEENSESVSRPEEKQAEVAELLTAEQINAMAEAKEKEEAGKKDNRSLWLGVGGAAGSYSPKAGMSASGAQADSYSSYAASMGIPQSVRHDVGSAYSAGLSGGMKLAKRWILQSGLSFISQQVGYTTNFVGITKENRATAMTADQIGTNSLDVVAVSNSYEVSSTTQVLSIPVQTGFLIVDRKLGWQLNTGVSTDFFLKNTLADKSGSRDKITESGGEGSPYRPVNFSGLLNTELSYRIGDHYRLALVPGIRYSFQPVLKDETDGTPVILDLGFRFNYLFK